MPMVLYLRLGGVVGLLPCQKSSSLLTVIKSKALSLAVSNKRLLIFSSVNPFDSKYLLLVGTFQIRTLYNDQDV
jgi:hypothetical protein